MLHEPAMRRRARATALAAAFACIGLGAAGADEYRFRFAGGDDGAPLFRWAGTDPREHIATTDAGLVISLKKSTASAVGIVGSFVLEGDFDMTVSFQLLDSPQPVSGCYGVGLSLEISAARAKQGAATIGAYFRPREKYVLVTDLTASGGRLTSRGEWHPAHEMAAKMRLKRSGSELRFLAAEGDNGFRELRRTQFTREAITLVRLVARRDADEGAFRARISEIAVQANSLPLARRHRSTRILWLACLATAGALAILTRQLFRVRWTS